MTPGRWYVVVAALNTISYYVFYLTLHGLGVQYVVAHVAATLVTTVLSYFLNCRFTFRVAPSWRTFFLFPLSSLTNLVITTGGLPLVVELTPVGEKIAPLVVGLIALPITFLISRHILVGRIPVAFAPETA